MRSRTTAGFVVIIGLVLICVITTLVALAKNSSELEFGQQMQTVADQARDALQGPNWRVQLDKVAGSAAVRDKGLSIIVPQNRRDYMRGIVRTKIEALLTPNQIKQFEKLDAATNAQPGGPPPNGGSGGRMSQILDQLNLTAAQKERTGSILEDTRERMRSVTDDQRNSPVILFKSQGAPALPPPPDRNGHLTKQQKEFDDRWMRKFSGAGEGRLVVVVRSAQSFQGDIRRRMWDMVYIGLFVVLLVGVGAWLLVGLTLAPIRKLAFQAANASTEDLRVRLEAPSNDAEVQELVGTLNDFLSRMAETAESKGRFYAAASHELRTPLQAMSGHLELALSRPREAEDYRGALEEAKKQSDRLKSLVQSLLLLHQLENNVVRERDEVDITAICKSILNHLQPTIEARKLQIELNLPDEALVSSIANHAEILARNLIENAVKYASIAGAIRIGLAQTSEGRLFTVFDNCQPIANWTTDKVFEAFYRPDTARNAKTGGNGLGLAICNAIAHADGWKLHVDQVEGGFLAQVTFPPAGAPMTETARKRVKDQKTSPAVA